jgi:gluconokinase
MTAGQHAAEARALVVMGVSGSGKTTIGRALAAHLDCPFYDGDDYHPAQNVAKMAAGEPLTDDDRAPWLASLAQLLADHLAKGQSAVLASSALKKQYRDRLRVSERVRFIFLDGEYDLIRRRMRARQGHYMAPEMLQSQFAALEKPAEDEALRVTVDRPVEAVVAEILQALQA